MINQGSFVKPREDPQRHIDTMLKHSIRRPFNTCHHAISRLPGKIARINAKQN